MNKPFNLEAFKSGQKALTREGRVVTFVGICDRCKNHYCKLLVFIEGNAMITSYSLDGECYDYDGEGPFDLVSMVSRHQHLIEAYNPEDTWQSRLAGSDIWCTFSGKPNFFDSSDYRIHPHNDLIKAHRNGAKIETMKDDGTWYEVDEPTFSVCWNYRIKPEPTIHCLVYDAKRFSHEQTTAVRARVVEKEVAEANGWKIIQEWEV